MRRRAARTKMGFFSKLFRERDPQQPSDASDASDAEPDAARTSDSLPAGDAGNDASADATPSKPADAASPRPRADTLRASPSADAERSGATAVPAVTAPSPPPPPVTRTAAPSSPDPSPTPRPPEPKVNKRRITMPAKAAAPTPVARGGTEPIATAPSPSSGPPPVPAVPTVAARADSGRISVPPPRRPVAAKTSSAPSRVGASEPPKPGSTAGSTTSSPARTRGRRDSTADLFAEIDTAIESAQEADGVDSREGVLEPDRAATAEMQRLFGEIAAQHAAHLRDFVIELSLAPTGKAWLDACAPAIEALKAAAAKIQHGELASALGRFEAVLRHAQGSPRTKIEGEPRQTILASYEELQRILPAAFEVSGQRDRREPIVLSALIAQVPGITSLDVHRIYGAGAMSLSMLVRAGASELSSVTGIPRERCAAILERISAYHRQRAEHPAATAGRQRVRQLLEALLHCETQFREAEEAEDRVRKRELRRERLQLAKQMELELTDLGNLELVADLRRESTERKIARVDRWLREPVAPPPSEHASPPQ